MAIAAWSGLDSMSNMDDALYLQWKTLLEDRTGMILPNERRSFLTTSLGIRMREIGFTDYQLYYEHVLNGCEGAIEWATLVDRLTVHETRFFRHMASVEMLRELVLPQWMSEDEPPGTIQCWSVGCSTGEEPYTLAMVLDHFRETDYCQYYFGITASDISLASLATGRKGVYHSRKLRDVDAVLRGKYFRRVSDTHFEVNEALRKRVCFAQLNVLEMEHVPIGKVHLIICQNMLIYFDRKRRIEILNNLVEHLLPGGVLILGAGEILGWQPPIIEKIEFNDTLAFRRLPSA
ncbi:protein-glutamate O-methyltransferase CheR [Sulfuriflexus sp.]|uniref:CheR family methyltransferase n=1 Tax=Sulfuriflexus sp. TaxID=2015443 RepID=UPI0028CCDE1E|nr:protein-glutamate O-methyltransferase CheR [Sulfuriflexus sp.]MDT8403127.1 protein-glutamate O-methyltransferase CheR [Sulfuriflexus sp.]